MKWSQLCETSRQHQRLVRWRVATLPSAVTLHLPRPTTWVRIISNWVRPRDPCAVLTMTAVQLWVPMKVREERVAQSHDTCLQRCHFSAGFWVVWHRFYLFLHSRGEVKVEAFLTNSSGISVIIVDLNKHSNQSKVSCSLFYNKYVKMNLNLKCCTTTN